MHLTNLPAQANSFFHAPCVLPAFPSVAPSDSTLVLIDHESDNERLEAGHADAHHLAIAHVETFRSLYPIAALGLYGLPYPRNTQQARSFGRLFQAILERCDFLAPCCYVSYDSDQSTIRRGHLFHSSILQTRSRRLRSMPRHGVVSPWLLDSSRACTTFEITIQVLAARAARCTSLYVWDGVTDQVRRALRPAAPSDAHFDDTQLARATLLGSYGFQVDDWSDRPQVEAALSAHARTTLLRFLDAWNDAR